MTPAPPGDPSRWAMEEARQVLADFAWPMSDHDDANARRFAAALAAARQMDAAKVRAKALREAAAEAKVKAEVYPDGRLERVAWDMVSAWLMERAAAIERDGVGEGRK